MQAKLVILGQLPGLNEYIRAERGNKFAAARMKEDTQETIGFWILQQLKGVKFARPVQMDYLWIEPDRRRDKSNIAFSKKFIEDALITSGTIPGDGWRVIHGFTDTFRVDKQNPRVEVTITEIEEGERCEMP